MTVFGQGLFFNGFRGRKEGSVVVGRTSPRYGRGDDSCETTVTLTALRAVQEMWCHFSRVDAAEAQMLEQRVKRRMSDGSERHILTRRDPSRS